jgi:hypothetical protein
MDDGGESQGFVVGCLTNRATVTCNTSSGDITIMMEL